MAIILAIPMLTALRQIHSLIDLRSLVSCPRDYAPRLRQLRQFSGVQKRGYGISDRLWAIDKADGKKLFWLE